MYGTEDMGRIFFEYSRSMGKFKKELELNENASTKFYEDYEENQDLSKYLSTLREIKNNVYDILRKAKNVSEDIEMYGINISKIKCPFFEKYNSFLSGMEDEIKQLETDNMSYLKDYLLGVLYHGGPTDIGKLHEITCFSKNLIAEGLCDLEAEDIIISYIEDL
jgi:hypothetical protein